MGASWNQHDTDPEPYDPRRLWRGVLSAVVIEGCVLLILLPIAYGLGWL